MVGLLLAFVSVLAAGAGHGTYLPARILFPFTMFSTILCGSITTPFIAIGLVQFPLYGFLLGVFYRLNHFRACLVGVTVTHLLAVALNLIVRSGHFPNFV